MTYDPETHTGGAPSRRVAIFIDGSNLYHSLEENCGRYDLNFHAFSQKLDSLVKTRFEEVPAL